MVNIGVADKHAVTFTETLEMKAVLLQNACKFVAGHMAFHPRREYCS
jgi:hypothetical protein